MVTNNNVLEAGERIPNFSLQDQSGEVHEFYTTMISGGPIVFVVIAGGGADNKPLLQALEENLPAFAALNAHLNVFSPDTPDAAAALIREMDLHFPLFGDPAKGVIEWFISAAQARDLGIFVMDPNQRLISFQTEADGDAAALISHALGELKRIAPKDDPRLLAMVAPVLAIPNVFSPDYCRHLIDLWATQGHAQATISTSDAENHGEQVDYGIFIRKDHTITDRQQQQELTNIIGSRLGPEMQKVFHYDNLIFEPYVIGCYEAADAGFFKAHRDNFNENLQHRRYAFSINLNAEDYEGGDLVFPEYGNDHYRPPTGCAAVFSCSILHEVLPVTKGRRFILQGFLGDVPRKQA